MNGVYVGSFRTDKLGTSATRKIRGVGFRPSTIIFWADLVTADGTATREFLGVAGQDWLTLGGPGTTVVRHCGMGDVLTDTSRNRTGFITRNVLQKQPSSSALGPGVVSMDADGFTITLKGEAANNTWWCTGVSYMAIFATYQTRIASWMTNTSTGNQSISGVTTIAPGLVIHLTMGAATDEDLPSLGTVYRRGIGMMTTAASWAIAQSAGQTGGVSVTNRQQAASKAILINDDDTDTEIADATYVSMDTTGFTINWGVAPASAIHMLSICLVPHSGESFRVGSFNKATGAAPATNAIAGIGHAPDGVMLFTGNQVTSASINAGGRFSMGASDGENEAGYTASLQDNAASPANKAVYQNRVLQIKDNDTTTLEAVGYVSSLDATGFTVTWDTNNAVATEIFYLTVVSTLPNNSASTGPATPWVVGSGDMNWISAMPATYWKSNYKLNSMPKGQIWIDTDEDPAIVRVGDGHRWRMIHRPYESLIGTSPLVAQNFTETMSGVFKVAASWTLDEPASIYSAFRIVGSIGESTINTWHFWLRINGDPDIESARLIWSTSNNKTVEAYIAPFGIDNGAQYEQIITSNPVVSTITAVVGGASQLTPGPISKIEVLCQSQAIGATVSVYQLSLFEQKREWYEYA